MTIFTTSPATGTKACTKLDNLQQRVACLADGGPHAIDNRLKELDAEWTAGRMTKASIGVMLVAGLALTAISNPWWLILPAAGGVFLLQYLFNRSSWLGKMFHEVGYRSSFEVDEEIMALKIIRGDFRHLPTFLDVESQEDISRLEGEGGIVVEPDTSKVAPMEAAKIALAATRH